MRLDHLLSKEHLAPGSPVMGELVVSRPTPRPNELGVVLEGGTSTTAGLGGRWLLVRLQLAVGRERMLTGWYRVGLARCWVLREQPFWLLYSGSPRASDPPVGGWGARRPAGRLVQRTAHRRGGQALGASR